MKKRPRCPECGAFVDKDGSHKKSTFTECSRRKRINAGAVSARADANGNSNTIGWESRSSGR